MRIIAVANNKGGIGKTTSVVNIGAALAEFEKRTLLIDFDPQANLSKSLGLRECEKTIYDALISEEKPEIYPVKSNLDIIPANLNLTKAEQQLDPAQGDHHLLKEILTQFESAYDYVLIDCPPSLNILTTSALTAATDMLIPVQAEFLALEGLVTFLDSVKKIKRRINVNLEIAGIFVTRFDQRKVLNRHVIETLETKFPELLMSKPVRENIALAEAPVKRTDIFEYAPKSYGAEDYRFLAREIIHKLEETTEDSQEAEKKVLQ